MLGPAGERYVGEIVRRLSGALGDELIAVYLIGSAAQGDWVGGRSDIDLLAVCATPLPAGARRRLAEPLRHRALACPARGLELVVYDREAVASPGPRARFQLNLNTGAGVEERLSLDPGEEPGHWFVIDLAIARAHARAVLGPPAERVIGPVARADALAALVESIDWYEENEGASANAVLGACRGWRYAAEGSWSSKAAAAAWALAAGADPGLIAAALAVRAGGAEALEDAAVRAFADRVRGAIRIAARSSTV